MSVQILIGDVVDRLASLPPDSVHCVVTSPPYWGLRDYGVAGQIGLEPTYQEHIAKLVAVFREVRRVLRDDGTVWLNYGDCWASSPNGRSAADAKAAGGDDRTFRDKPFSTIGEGLKPKDLCMMPHRLAIALQDDGWWVRSDIVWHKPNPMPSSVKDRPTPAKEYLFLLSKSARYYYDDAAIREEATGDPSASRNRWDTKDYQVPGQKPQKRKSRSGNLTRTPGSDTIPGASHIGRGFPWEDAGAGRNKRDVWTIATEPFPGAHFATMPTALVEPCILAGTSARGVCPACGAPWARLTNRDFQPQADAPSSDGRVEGQTAPETRWAGSQRGAVAISTRGWSPSCDCGRAPVPATVLDPFGGAGTVGLVADRLGRHAVLIELNPTYAEIARARIADDSTLLAAVEVA